MSNQQKNRVQFSDLRIGYAKIDFDSLQMQDLRFDTRASGRSLKVLDRWDKAENLWKCMMKHDDKKLECKDGSADA